MSNQETKRPVTRKDVLLGHEIADLIVRAYKEGNPEGVLAAAVRHMVNSHGYEPLGILRVATGIVGGVNGLLRRSWKNK